MSFGRAERLVTAFLCLSGAAESCVLPFLCLHLCQLGVPPLQTGVAVSALLLLRGCCGALWWRALRADRRPGRRRLAAAAGALLSAAVMCSLAILPPSTVCTADPGTAHAEMGHQDGPTPALGQQAGSSGGGQLRPAGGVTASQRPPAVGSGRGADYPQSSTSRPAGSHVLSVTSETSQHPRPTSDENSHTNELQRQTSSETSERERPTNSGSSGHERPMNSEDGRTSQYQRPETSETTRTNKPATSETSGTSISHRPTTSENNENPRLENGETSISFPPEQSKTDGRIQRPTPTELSNLHPVTHTSSHISCIDSAVLPTTAGASGHTSRPASALVPPSGPVEPSPQSGAAAAETVTPGMVSGSIHAPHTALPDLPLSLPSSASLAVPPSIAPSVPPVMPPNVSPSEPTGRGTWSVADPAESTEPPVTAGQNSRPATEEPDEPAAGTVTGTNVETETETEAETEDGRRQVVGSVSSSSEEGTRLPLGVTGALAQPGVYHSTHSSDAESERIGSQTAPPSYDSNAVPGDSQATSSDSENGGLAGSPTPSDIIGETPRGADLHLSSSSAAGQTAQNPPSSGSQTPGHVSRPASASGRQPSDVLDSHLGGSDETEVRRTTRSPLSVESAGKSEEESESSGSESESPGVGSESVDRDSVVHVSLDESNEFENPSATPDLPPDVTGSGPLSASPIRYSEEQERSDETDQFASVSPSFSDSSEAQNEHQSGGHPTHHHHHHHHNSRHRTESIEEAGDTERGTPLVVKLPHEDAELSHNVLGRNRLRYKHQHLSTDGLDSRPLNWRPSKQPHMEPPRGPPGRGDAHQRCVPLAEVEIPWDPRKHPGGITVCEPHLGRPAAQSAVYWPGRPLGQPSGQGSGDEPGHRSAEGSVGGPGPGPTVTGRRRHSVGGDGAPAVSPPAAVGDLSDPETLGPPSVRHPGRAPGSGRRPLSGRAGHQQTHRQSHFVNVDQEPPEPPPRPSDMMNALRRAAAAPRGSRMNNSPQPAEDGPGPVPPAPVQGTPQSPSGGDLTESGDRAGGGHWGDSDGHPADTMDGAVEEDPADTEGRAAIGDPADTEDGAVRGDPAGTEDGAVRWDSADTEDLVRSEGRGRGESQGRRLGFSADRRRTAEESIWPAPGKHTSISSSVGSTWKGHSLEAGSVSSQQSGPNLQSSGDSELWSGQTSLLIRSEVVSPDAVSPDLHRIQAGENGVQSRDRQSEARSSAELRSGQGRIQAQRSRAGRGSVTHETDSDGEYSGETELVSSHYRHHYQQPGGQESSRSVYRPSRRRSGGRSRHYKIPVRPADGGSTAEPTSWSLTGALHRLEDLSPTLTRLLSGSDRRRETRRRPRRRGTRRRRERAHWRRRRRQKRSVGDIPIEQMGSHEGRIEAGTVRDRLWRKGYINANYDRSNNRNSEALTRGLAQSPYQLGSSAALLHTSVINNGATNTSLNLSQSSEGSSRSPGVLSPPLPSAQPSPGPAAPVDRDLLFLVAVGLLGLWGSAGAPHRRLVQLCWRRTLEEAEHLERAGRGRPAEEAVSALLLGAAAGLWPLLPPCLPAGRRPLAALPALGAGLTLLAGLLLPWLPLAGGKEPPPRTAALLRTLLSSRGSLLFTAAVFVTGLLSSAEFHFLFPLTATWRPAPAAALLLSAAAALASRLAVRALYRPLMVRCGFTGSVVLSLAALSARCVSYVCVPSAWGLVPTQLLTGLTDTLLWRAAHVFSDRTARYGAEAATLRLLGALYSGGRCCGVLLAGGLFSAVGGPATFTALATVSSAAALGYHVTARFSGDAPDLVYSKLPCDDSGEMAALTGPWSRDPDDPDEVTDSAPAGADQDWLERAMRREGLL